MPVTMPPERRKTVLIGCWDPYLLFPVKHMTYHPWINLASSPHKLWVHNGLQWIISFFYFYSAIAVSSKKGISNEADS